MTTPDDSTPPEKGHLSALGAAMLRISASLDLETVLHEVVDSARALTGARYGAIATIDETLRYVRDALDDAGYAPLVTGDHRELSHILETEKPALVLLDLILPGADGIALMETVPELADLPVIFISGYGRDETIARALEAGADDYIIKPFSPTELTARIRAALRRRADPEPFVLGELVIDYDRRRVSVAGNDVELSATEYELLRVLTLAAGRVVTHDALLRQVWNRRSYADAKLVRAFVRRLRMKLGDDATRPAYILTRCVHLNVRRTRFNSGPLARPGSKLSPTASRRLEPFSRAKPRPVADRLPRERRTRA